MGPTQYSNKGWGAFWTRKGGTTVIIQSNYSLKVLANTIVSSDYNLHCSPHPHNRNTGESRLPSRDTSILDSGASGIYLTPAAPCTGINTAAPPINVGTASVTRYTVSASFNLQLPTLLVRGRHIIPGFQQNLVGIGNLCNRGCNIIYEKQSVHVMDETSKVLLQGWREPTGARLSRFSLRSGMHHHSTEKSPLATTTPHLLRQPTMPMTFRV